MADVTTTKTAAKKKAAPKRKPAAPKQREQQPQAVKQVPVETADVGLRLAGLVAGRAMAESGEAMDMGERRSTSGLTLDEISMLLQQREARGYHQGHSEAYREARQNLGLRMQAERSEAVAGTLAFVVGQLEPVLHGLAARNAPEQHATARQHLVTLCSEFARAADRLAGENGEGEPVPYTQIFGAGL